MSHDDTLLLEQWKEHGDAEAFRLLVSRYGGVVYSACRRILGERPDVDDVAQECFEALAAAGTKPGAYLGPWLHRVATYHALRHIRSEKRRRQRESRFCAPKQPDLSVEWKDVYEFVDEAVNALPDALRVPLIAHYLEGKTKESVAQDIGISRQLASYRIDQGIKRVRKTLKRKGVFASIAVLAGLMKANAAQAAPAAFIAKTARIAIAGPEVSAPIAALPAVKAASRASLKVAALKTAYALSTACAVAAIGLFLGWKEIWRPYPTQDITAKSSFSVKPSSTEADFAAVRNGQKNETPQATEPAQDASAPAVEKLEPGTVFYGVVFDQEHRPVPAARVSLDNKEQEDLLEFFEKQGAIGVVTSVEHIDLHTTSDANGRFTFPRVTPPLMDGLILTAEARGLNAVKTIAQHGEVRQRRHDLTLAPAACVKGKLIDEKNMPIPDARVSISPQRCIGEIRSFDAFTDKDGIFTSRPVSPGMYELLFLTGEFRNDERPWINADGQMHIFRLQRKGSISTISGRVLDVTTGAPFPDLMIRAGSYQAASNSDGTFTIRANAPGKYALSIGKQSSPYVLTEPMKIQLEAGKDVTGVELKATRGVTVSGRILDSETKLPVPRAYLDASSPVNLAYATADEKGHYRLEGLGVSTYACRVRKPQSFCMTDAKIEVTSFQDMDGVDLIVGPFPTLRGKVLSTSGIPIAGASVAVFPTVNFMRMIVTSDENGMFDIPLDARIPSAHIQAYGDGCISRLQGPIRPGESCVLELETSGGISGIVQDTSGRAIPDAIVVAIPAYEDMFTAISDDGSQWHANRGIQGTRCRTLATGDFELEPLIPGDYALEVYLPSSAKGYPIAATTVRVKPQETIQTTLVVDIAGMASIEGTVTSGGAPLPYSIVEAYSSENDWIASIDTRTDANGAYSLHDIRAGEIRVTAWMPGAGHRTSVKTVRLAENESKTLDFAFDESHGGIEGTVTINRKPGRAFVDVDPKNSDNVGEHYSTMASDVDGSYRVANLAPGAYSVRASHIDSSSCNRLPRISEIQINGNETARCDFTFETATLEGTVRGLAEGETAGVALFTQPLDIRMMSVLTSQAFEEMMIINTQLQPGEPFKWDDLDPGVYYLGAVVLPAGSDSLESAVTAGILSGRYTTQPVELKNGAPVNVPIVLPGKK